MQNCAALITIGDEILIGQTINTNAAYMGRMLNELGYDVVESTVVPDEEQAILDALAHAHERSDIVLMTGGLGPTKDDITKKTLAKYFHSEMTFVPEILERIEAYFRRRNRSMLEVHRELALLPDNCEVLLNEKGTAAAMWFDLGGKVTVSMPGVPYEMTDFMERIVLPRLRERVGERKTVNYHLLTAGLGETLIADRIAPVLEKLPEYVSMAYLPSLGTVRLRLTANGTDEAALRSELEGYAREMAPLIGSSFVSFGQLTLEQELGRILTEHKLKMATAESCTGGQIARQIVAIPGSSAYFMGSIVAYSYAAKSKLLGVDPAVIEREGAVSEAVVRAMVTGVLEAFQTDYAIGVSGVAGPGGGTPDKPVGTVWIAVGSRRSIRAKRYQLTDFRDLNIPLSANYALNNLRKLILEESAN